MTAGGERGRTTMIQLDYSDTRPLYEQIKDKIKALIIRNILSANEQLPSVRDLAANLTLNPNTIQKAYRDLEQEGYIYSVRGKGNFVAEISQQLKEDKRMQLKGQLVELLTEMQQVGISLQMALAWVQAAYETEGSALL
jgi:GntR family transcriptional regulator